MFHHSWPMDQDLWILYHKVTFDGVNKLIIVNDNEADIDIQIDVYSDWKEWAAERDHLKFLAALRTVGGDPTVAPDSLGATFFTINGWQILVNHTITFDGNLFSDDFATPLRVDGDTAIATLKVSNLIDKVAIETGDLVSAGVALTTDITSQTTIIQTDISNQTITLEGSLPPLVVSELQSTQFDGVSFADIMAILLAMAQGRILESATGVFQFYAQDNSTVLYTLTKSGSERTRS